MPSPPPRDADPASALTALIAEIAAVGSEPELPTVVVPDGEASGTAREVVLRQLAAGPRSRATLENKLRAKEIPDDVAAVVLDRFEQLKLIDDRAYAEMFVRAKHRDRGLGRRALRMELHRKGVAAEHIDDAVAGIDGDDEERAAVELVGKRLGSALAAGPQAARRRLLGLLARRGYSSSLANRVVDEALSAAGPTDPALEDSGDDPAQWGIG